MILSLVDSEEMKLLLKYVFSLQIICSIFLSVATGSTSGQANKLETDDNIYIGGHRGKHPYK